MTGLKVGATVADRYRVERILGRGGLGCAYRCNDLLSQGAIVMLRILTDWGGAGGIAALRQELSFLSRLKHPYLASLHDFGIIEPGSTPFLVRQYLEGADVIQGSEGWSVDQVSYHLVKICRVLQYLHLRGIVHQHLKPSNIILAEVESGSFNPILLDAGIMDRRKKKGRGEPARLAYAAPEVLLGHLPTPRSDLYSLGILAYQIFTRRLPFDDEDEGYLIQKQLQGRADMRPIERLKGGAGLVQVLLGLMEKNPEKRPSSAEDVIRLLSAAAGHDYSGTVSGLVDPYFSAGRFVGREREMSFLQERAARVRESNRGLTVFLLGESGSGKSRCMEELRTWGLLDGWRVVEAACLPREDRSYGPYRRILARAGRLHPAPAGDGGESAIFRFADDAGTAQSAQLDMSSGAAAGPFRDLLTRELVRILSDRPTMLMLHDFHWADEATVAVLDYLTADIQAQPIFLCASLRRGEAEHGPMGRLLELSARQHRSESISLEALSEQAVEELIAGITGESALGREIGHWMNKSSGGNPFFVEEILKHLVDRGLLQRKLGKWRLAEESVDKLRVPSSVAAVLRHRLAQLSPGTAGVIQWLALIRRAVPKEQLRMLSAIEPEEFENRLRELLSRQIIREVHDGGEEAFEFRHALISEVIAEDLPPHRHRRMHKKIGEFLELHQGESENLQELATHFTEGRCGEKAIHYALKAARSCKAEFANEAALRFYEYLLRNKKQLPLHTACDVCIEAADTYCALGNPKRAVKILISKTCRIGLYKAGLDSEVRRLAQLSLCYQYSGDIRALAASARYGLVLTAKLNPDRYGVLKACFLKQLAYCSLIASRPREALSLLDLALNAIAGSDDDVLEGRIYSLISANQRVACNLRAAVSAAQKAIDILEPLNALPILTTAYSHMGISQAALGRFRNARFSHERAVAISHRTRSPILRSQALGNFAECLCRSGDLERAHDASVLACNLITESANPAIQHSAKATMAEVKLAEGHYHEASLILHQLNNQDSMDLPKYSKAHVFYLMAMKSYAFNDLQAAIAYLDRLSSIESTEAPVYEHGLGEILRAKIYYYCGEVEKSLQLLYYLNKTLIKRRWPYHMCLTRIALAELLLRLNDFSFALKHSKVAFKLANAMSCPHLQAYANLLIGQATLKLWASNSDVDFEKTLISKIHFDFLDSLKRAEDCGATEIIWRIHSVLAHVSEVIGNYPGAVAHSEKTLAYQKALVRDLPTDQAFAVFNHPERNVAYGECQDRIQRLQDKMEMRLKDSIEMEEAHLRLLYRASCAINGQRNFDQLISCILDYYLDFLTLERALLVLKEKDDSDFRIVSSRRIIAASIADMDSLSRFVIEEVAKSEKPWVTSNARLDPRLEKRDPQAYYAGSIFCAPLTIRGCMFGIVYADSKNVISDLSESSINFFAALCNLVAIAIDNAIAHRKLIQEKSELQKYLEEVGEEYPELVGRSDAIKRLKERIAIAAVAPLDILIWGESGTGKELVARALHRTGRRNGKKFIPVDCGSISDTLVEGELFGFRRGAFTGALENRAGLFEAADGGIIFLDEISNMSLRLQQKLLRVLEQREIRRIGELSTRSIDVQVIAATNKNPQLEMRKGRLRKDLYYRLNEMEIRVPSLRERREDVPLLLELFLNQISSREGGKVKYFSRESYGLLLKYSFPGNVRELKNCVAGAYFSAHGPQIEVQHLPSEIRDGGGMEQALEEKPEAWQIYKAMRDGSGNFETLVKTPFLRHEIILTQVRQIIQMALVESNGRYRNAFKLLGIPAREYAITIQFLKRNRCYIDYRAYRNSGK